MAFLGARIGPDLFCHYSPIRSDGNKSLTEGRLSFLKSFKTMWSADRPILASMKWQEWEFEVMAHHLIRRAT
jgi:hypothetical protein